MSLGKKNNNWYIGPSTGLNYNGLGDYVVCGYGETRTFKGIRHLELDSWAWYHVVRVSLCAMATMVTGGVSMGKLTLEQLEEICPRLPEQMRNCVYTAKRRVINDDDDG